MIFTRAVSAEMREVRGEESETVSAVVTPQSVVSLSMVSVILGQPQSKNINQKISEVSNW